MAKAVEGRWSLQDRVTPAIQRMNKETLKYKSTVRSARKSISEDWNQLKTGVKIAAAAVAGGLITVGFAAKNVSEAAKAQIEAETKLSAVLKNVKGVTDQQIIGLEKYASALQNVGVIGDEVQLSGVQQLGTFQLQAATIEKLMPSMADLVAQQKGLNATQQDAVNIGNLVGKAMMGQTGALSRVGISFTDAQAKVLKYGTETQKAAILAEVLQQNVGGVNKALAETDQGRIKQTTNVIGDMKEVIGKTVLMIEGKFAGAFMKNLPQIELVVQSISNSLDNWANNGGVDRTISALETAGSTIKDIYGGASAVFNFFKNNWGLLGPIIYTATAAIVAYKTATLATNVATVLLDTTTKGLNRTFALSPVGKVVAVMALLILAGTYVVKNWETIKLAGMNTWNVVVDAAQWSVNKFIGLANFTIQIFKFAWDSIEYAGKSIWNGVVSAAEGGLQKLLTPVNAVRKALGKDAIEVNFSAVKSVAVKPTWDASFNAIPKVDFGGAKFGQDSIMEQTRKAQEERDKKNAAQLKALTDNTKALMANSSATDKNTTATDTNTDGTNDLNGTLQDGVPVNMTAEQVADTLMPRLERHLYGTT